MATGWERLGAAFGGDSEEAYQEGLALGAKTEAALAEARERVEANAARGRNYQNMRAMGVPDAQARAMADAVTSGKNFGDPIEAMLKSQTYDFNTRVADPNVPLDQAQRIKLAQASGPVTPIYKVGNRAFNMFKTPDNIEDLGAVFGDDVGSSSFIQSARAFGLLNPDGSISPENRALAYEILRNTDKAFDVGGVPMIRTGNPFVTAPGAPVQPMMPSSGPVAPSAPATAPATAPAAAPVQPLATIEDVARNKGTIAAATEQGQAQGRNAAGLEGALAVFNKFEQDVNGLLSAPGFRGLYGNLQGTDAGKLVMGLLDQDVANARAALDTLGGEAFLASIQRMRGFGQLSNQEGLKVQTALTRALDTRLSEDEARRAWAEVKLHLAELRRVAAIEAGQAPGGTAPVAPTAPTAPGADGWQVINGVRIRVKPQ